MAEALAETPGSSSTGKAPAVKDRECQYCHQAFTSSSLGRHLDLYIKGKNAKPPDDIHDVEEIRRLRGNVTRRQARTSSRKREGSTPSSAKATPLRDQRSPSVQRGYHSNHPRYQDGGPIRTYLNKPNWQSTGVINNLPSTLDNPIYSGRQSPSRRTSVKEEIIHKQNMLEERDRARAAELALREVLDSVQAAKYAKGVLWKLHADTIPMIAPGRILHHPSISTSSRCHFRNYACNAYRLRSHCCRVPPYRIPIRGRRKRQRLRTMKAFVTGLRQSWQTGGAEGNYNTLNQIITTTMEQMVTQTCN